MSRNRMFILPRLNLWPAGRASIEQNPNECPIPIVANSLLLEAWPLYDYPHDIFAHTGSLVRQSANRSPMSIAMLPEQRPSLPFTTNTTEENSRIGMILAQLVYFDASVNPRNDGTHQDRTK